MEVLYLGLTRDNRIHIGGARPSYSFNNGPGDPSEAAPNYAQLRRELLRLYPKLDGIEFDAKWSGIVDWTLNESPSVGRTGKHNNIFYGLGYSGHGVNLTSVFGENQCRSGSGARRAVESVSILECEPRLHSERAVPLARRESRISLVSLHGLVITRAFGSIQFTEESG